MSLVHYRGKRVSDADVRKVLARIAKTIGPVYVTSGDRGHVPKGGSHTSLHLIHQAVDFGIVGMSLEEGFKRLYRHQKDIFSIGKSYEVIWHGKFTKTGGPHLHIGRYRTNGRGIKWKMEGETKGNKGKYSLFL